MAVVESSYETAVAAMEMVEETRESLMSWKEYVFSAPPDVTFLAGICGLFLLFGLCDFFCRRGNAGAEAD